MTRTWEIVVQAIRILLEKRDPGTLTEVERAIVRSSDLRVVLSMLEVAHSDFQTYEREFALHLDLVARRRQLEDASSPELLNLGTRLKSEGHIVRPWDARDLQMVCEILHARGDDGSLTYFGLVKTYPDYAGYMD